MKKTTILLFGISVFAGLGYLAFSKTPVGKKTLMGWLLKKWQQAAEKKSRSIDQEPLKTELQKLCYDELELLVGYTWRFPVLPEPDIPEKDRKRFVRKMQQIKESGLFEKADLSALENIVFPG